MAQKKKTIEDHLKEMHLPSYEEYVAKSKADAQSAWEESVARADTDYAKAKATYGTRASYLMGKGLSASGYSDYLENAAYAAYNNRLGDADKQRAASEESARSDYAAFLKSAEEEAKAAYDAQEKNTASAFAKLLSQNIADEDVAKDYLVTLGIDEETATLLAEKSIAIQRASLSRRNAILNYAIENYLPYERTYRYAIANGLSSESAHEIASIVQSLRK